MERFVRRPIGILILVAILVVGVAWQLLPLQEWLQRFGAWVGTLGAWGVLIFGLLYVVGTLALAPVSLMSIAAGLAFGLWGIPFVIVSASLGAVLAFLIARHVAYQSVSQALEKQPKL